MLMAFFIKEEIYYGKQQNKQNEMESSGIDCSK